MASGWLLGGKSTSINICVEIYDEACAVGEDGDALSDMTGSSRLNLSRPSHDMDLLRRGPLTLEQKVTVGV